MTDYTDLIQRAIAAIDGVAPGPWAVGAAQWPEQVGCCPLIGRPYSIHGTDFINVSAAITQPNARFIAAARQLVPDLTAALAAVTAERDKANAEWADANSAATYNAEYVDMALAMRSERDAIKAENARLQAKFEALKKAHNDNFRVLSILSSELHGRVEAGKLGAIFRCAQRSYDAIATDASAEGGADSAADEVTP